MPSLLQIVLSNAIMATALALLVAIIGFVVRRPALTHVLWLLVLLKLITPGVVVLPVSWPTANEKLSSASDSVAPSQLVAPSESETDVAPASDPRQEVTLLIYPAADSSSPDASLDSTAEAISVLPTGAWQSLAKPGRESVLSLAVVRSAVARGLAVVVSVDDGAGLSFSPAAASRPARASKPAR